MQSASSWVSDEKPRKGEAGANGGQGESRGDTAMAMARVNFNRGLWISLFGRENNGRAKPLQCIFYGDGLTRKSFA